MHSQGFLRYYKKAENVDDGTKDLRGVVNVRDCEIQLVAESKRPCTFFLTATDERKSSFLHDEETKRKTFKLQFDSDFDRTSKAIGKASTVFYIVVLLFQMPE
jgi:phage protein U